MLRASRGSTGCDGGGSDGSSSDGNGSDGSGSDGNGSDGSSSDGSANWEFASDDGGGAASEGWADPFGGPSEDEEGDWVQTAFPLQGRYSNKRLELNPPGYLSGNMVQVSYNGDEPLWYRVAAWPPAGAPHERRSTYNAGGALLLRGRCGDMLERCLQARGLLVRMEDVWRYLIRQGCPDGSTIEYGGGVSSCWGGHGGRRFEAGADSAWLLAEPPMQPPMPVPSAQQQAAVESLGRTRVQGDSPAGSGLLSLDDDCLRRLAGAVGRPQGVLTLMRLATCCRRLRGLVAEQLPDDAEAWEQECRRAAPWLDWAPAPAPGQQRLGPGAACGLRARYAVLANALEAPTSGLCNGLRIGGVIQRMLDELEAPMEQGPAEQEQEQGPA